MTHSCPTLPSADLMRAGRERGTPAMSESPSEREDHFASWLTDWCWKVIPSLGMSAHSEGGNNAGWKKAINQDASRSREIVCTCSPVLRAVGRHLCLQVATLDRKSTRLNSSH